MNKETYIQILEGMRKKRLSRLKKVFISGFIGIVISVLPYVAVKADKTILPMPSEAVDYLQSTLFTSFDIQQYEGFIESDTQFLFGLLLYGSYYLGLIIFVISAVLLAISKDARNFNFSRPSRKGIMTTHDIRCLIADEKLFRSNKGEKQFRTLWLRLYPVNHLSPMTSLWFSRSSFKWLPTDAIKNKYYGMIWSLWTVDYVVGKYYVGKKNMSELQPMLDTLENCYYMLAVIEGDPILTIVRDRDEDIVELRRNLAMLHSEVHPLYLNVEDVEKSIFDEFSKKGRYRRVLADTSIQRIGVLALGSGTVMAVGSIVFAISAQQAFLTWFTVTFGGSALEIIRRKIHPEEHSKEEESLEEQAESASTSGSDEDSGKDVVQAGETPSDDVSQGKLE